MPATNFTPILLYRSGTTTNQPTAGNLNQGELAINYADGRLFYKDAAGTPAIQIIGARFGANKTTGETIGAAFGAATGVTGNPGNFVFSAAPSFTGDISTTGTLSATKLIPTGNVTAGNGMYLPTTNTLAFSTDGSERMRIDSSGNVGIGTSSPSSFGTLAVQSANNVNGYFANSATSGSTASSQVRLATYDGSSVSVGSYFIETANSWSNTVFAGGAANTTVVQGTKAGGLSLISKASSAPIKFYLNGEASTDEKMRITSGGNLLVGTTTNNASGGVIQVSNGITFPATQSASSDANTLDDYEEGTWTPSIEGTSTAGTASYAIQNARYTKIGRVVQIECYVQWSSGTGTGNLRLIGLPFTSSNSSTYPQLATSSESIALTANNYMISYVNNNSTNITIAQNPIGGGARSSVAYDAGGEILVAGTYSV